MKKRILITGGAGFLGSHLCERLLGEGYQIFCVDTLYTGSRANVAPFLENPDFKFLMHDIREPLALDCDAIYNLACPASPRGYQADPIYTMTTCMIGSLNLLELAGKNKARILQASTSEVYGDPEVHPQPETYWGRTNPIGVRSCYDEGKRCAETLFFDYWRQYRLPIKIVRIFNTYGPRMQANDGRVVSNFIVQALQNEAITIYGDGKQTRSFCYVDDLIDVMILMMQSPEDFVGPVNIGNPGEFTMLELAEAVLRLTGSKSQLVFKPLPADDPKQRRPDIGLARSKLSWQPKVALEDGLKETISYFKRILNT